MTQNKQTGERRFFLTNNKQLSSQKRNKASLSSQNIKHQDSYSLNLRNSRECGSIKLINTNNQKRSQSSIKLQDSNTNHKHTMSNTSQRQQQCNNRLNPQINYKLEELIEKVELIQSRQKKLMQQQGNYKRQSICNARKAQIVKNNPSSMINTFTVSQQLKQVKDEINELKSMMHIIRQRDQDNYKTNKIIKIQTIPNNLDKLKTTNVKINTDNIINKKAMTSSKEITRKINNEETICPKKSSISTQMNIYLQENQLTQQVQIGFKPIHSLVNTRKGKPNLSSNISSIPKGVANKNFRINKNQTKNGVVISPYIEDEIRNKSKNNGRRSIARSPKHFDVISLIQDEFEPQDLKRRITILPKLPQGFNPLLDSQKLMQLAKELFTTFNVSSNWTEPINIKKYKNCVFFNHLESTVLWHYDNKFYIGGWSEIGEGNKQGYGIESVPQKFIYEGQFQKGKRNGYGAMSSINGEYYKGYWVQGFRDGKGKIEQIDGSIYEGEWKRGKKQGYGRIRISKKQYYQGYFKDGMKNGQGKQLFKNGDAYQGQYLSGKFNGYGIYRWQSGASYNGQFRGGQRHGKGIWLANSSLKSDVYQGEYQNDKKSGIGKYKWQNGSVYIGCFSNDQKNGQGTIYYNDGKILQAIWMGDQIVRKIYTEKAKTIKSKY